MHVYLNAALRAVLRIVISYSKLEEMKRAPLINSARYTHFRKDICYYLLLFIRIWDVFNLPATCQQNLSVHFYATFAAKLPPAEVCIVTGIYVVMR